jgi:hypothetical protein
MLGVVIVLAIIFLVLRRTTWPAEKATAKPPAKPTAASRK